MALLGRIAVGLLNRFKDRNLEIKTDKYLLYLSATLDISESYSNSISVNQIENGTNITDHLHPSPLILPITAILSNDDFDYLNPSNLFLDDAEDVKKQLIEIAETGSLCKIRYGGNIYTSMGIQSLTFQKTSEIGNNYNCSMTFQKIVIATAQSGTIAKGKIPVQTKPPKSILKGIFG
jgi:hypothetical protein